MKITIVLILVIMTIIQELFEGISAGKLSSSRRFADYRTSMS